MPACFDLIITADYPSRSAEFRLLDAHGAQLAFRQTNFKAITASHFQGLFDLRNFLRHYVAAGNEAAAVAEIGVCIAQEVLGAEIFRHLWASESQRTLRIQLPGATEQENYLAAALARVPWEIARPVADQPTLGERNLLVRVVHDRLAPASQPVALMAEECLRVLFVFAEARGSHPLGARQERIELARLLAQEVYPQRRVVAHFLSHGVTRARLMDQISAQGGYHIVHWSGHGNLNLLELAQVGGAKDHISGEQLLKLFTQAGGFLPTLFFLSACHSGDILRVQDWNDFIAIAQGKEPGTRGVGTKDADADSKKLELKEQPGFTGTAHALLQGGVPSVVAMRFAVGDDYARELAVEFYRALLAHAQPKSAAAAMTMARQAMLDGNKHTLARFAVCDHATPVLYGVAQPGLTLAPGRSPELDTRDRHLPPIAELSLSSHAHFVGRTWELAELGANFIGAKAGAEVQPVAVITGLGGMGKTALVAEALSLWEKRFEWVLLYRAKPNALAFEATLSDIHRMLKGEQGRYQDHVNNWPADAIYRDADASFTGPARMARLTRNLLRALKDEPLLLVLDNFETNLKPQADHAAASCQDPDWERCLAAMAVELTGAPSRVLMTCRRPLAALAGHVCSIQLGPLPAAEAALYLRAHPALNRMLFATNAAEQALARRLLTTSRFHPLLMDRLARLAQSPSLRAQLLQALDTLENSEDFAQLPALFASQAGNAKELAYLKDALATSLDQLIGNASVDARRVLWLIAVANEPVALALLRSVWRGEDDPQQAQLRQIKQMLETLPLLPPELQEKLKALPPEFHALLDALPPELPQRSELPPLLHQLVSVGLVTEEHTEPDDAILELSCHELVRERIRAWMQQQPQDQGEFSENSIRLAYAERLAAVFESLQHQNMTAALQAGSRALIYCVQAEAWDRLGGFAGSVVTSSDPRLLAELIPHLQSAAESAPEGEPRWRCLCNLADALRRGGRADTSLIFYAQAASQARAAAEVGGDAALQASADLAWIAGNWANALLAVGNLDAARQRKLDSAQAHQQAGNPTINVIGCELEALRIDIMQDKVATALPQIESRLVQVQQWWQAQRSSQPVPEAPDAEVLARALVSALDIATAADFAQKNWESALQRLDAMLKVEQALRRSAQDIAGTRMNRANVLRNLDRFGEARAELEACLLLFQNNPARSAATLGSLADLFAKQDDVAQAITQQRRALALHTELPNPTDRAISHGNLASHLERLDNASALAE
jgi:hypothetical protein